MSEMDNPTEDDSKTCHLPSSSSTTTTTTTTTTNSSSNIPSSIREETKSSGKTQDKKKLRRVPSERRKKVARACDVCKKRKQRCNGTLPCNACVEKDFQCSYTGIDRRNLKPSKRELELRNLQIPEKRQQHPQAHQHVQPPPPPLQVPQNHQASHASHASQTSSITSFLPPSLQPLFHFPLSIQSSEEGGATEKNNDMTITLEKEGLNSRLLYDTNGNLRYIGESSAGSFLPQCRKVFEKILGVSKFTHDPQRFVMVDSPAFRGMRIPINLPPREYSNYLLKLFKKNINSICYVFNEEYLDEHLFDYIYQNPLQPNTKKLCLVNLVQAIGSIFAKVELQRSVFPFPLKNFIEPQIFHEGAQNLLNTTVDDCNLWLVETHFLMYFYDELNMTRNRSWIQLGTAIRYALGLGMQRRYVNESYEDSEYVLHRRKLFRSLYIKDRFCSTHLGRSLTINDLEWDDKSALDQLNDLQNELLKVSILNGKILTKVYYNPSIGMKIALKLAVELKIFTVNSSISKSLSLQNTLRYNDNHGLLLLHINHLHGIILLSRPFFFFIILIKLKIIKFDESSKNYSNLKIFHQSGMKASLLTIKLIEFYFVNNLHPLKGYAIVSCSFHAGLLLGMALLLQSQNVEDVLFDTDASNQSTSGENSRLICLSAMNSAINILKYYGKIDPNSNRYGDIISNMMESTKVQQQTYQKFANKQGYQEQQPIIPQPLAPLQHQKQQSPMSTSVPSLPLQPPGSLSCVEINLNNLINPSPSSATLQSTAAPGVSSQRFEDWLFPNFDNNSNTTSSSANSQSGHATNLHGIPSDSNPLDRYNQGDNFLKDLAGLNNMTTSGNQFLDDFLFNVVEGTTSNVNI